MMIPGYVDNSACPVAFRTGMHTEKAQHAMCWLKTVFELGIQHSSSLGIQHHKMKPSPMDLVDVRSLSLGVDDSFEICFYGRYFNHVSSDMSAYLKKLFVSWCLNLLQEFGRSLPLAGQADLSTLTMPVKSFLTNIAGVLEYDINNAYALSEYDMIEVHDICSYDNAVTVKDLHDAAKFMLGEAECPNDLAGWPLNPIEVELADDLHNIFARVKNDVIDEWLSNSFPNYERIGFAEFLHVVHDTACQILNAWQEDFPHNALSEKILDHLSSSEIQLLNQWHEVMKSHNSPV